MNTQYFKYALEIARCGSITEAANNLYMGQPNLSKAIKELESQLGYVIFDRTYKGMFPTKDGVKFLEHASNILRELDKMELIHIQEKKTQVLRVSIPRGSYIAQGFIDFVKMLKQEEGMQINMKETNSIQTIQDLVDETFQIGIIRYPLTHTQYFCDYLQSKAMDSETLWEFEHMVVMSKQHFLATAHMIQYEQLLQYPEISHGDNVIPYLKSKVEDKQQQKKINVYDRFNQFHLLENVITTYMWTSPLPKHILDKYGLVQKRCSNVDRYYRDVLVYRKGLKLEPLDEQFIREVKKWRDIVARDMYKKE